MKLLKTGSSGNDVRHWQTFLIGIGLYQGVVTGKFDEATRDASIAFQMANNLEPDGLVGNKTIGAAMLQGFSIVTDTGTGNTSSNWPPRPSFPPLIDNAARQKVFGKFDYAHRPVQGNYENIEVLGDWAKNNIIKLDIPQLIPIKGNSIVYFHRLAATQFKKLWSDWEKAGLMHLVLTWAGTYAPRFVRGSKTTLSNHAFGSAFDINVAWNGLGVLPPLVGQKGSVRQLVPIAHDNGFYWGGHFKRLDGMHFEVAKLK
ncbi:MAG TPA: M15 family metallopeptidase [Ferruginibacter sp.]|nr:M15 family metallopeptidase [Ferruginibacter sp.]HMP21477.1 M15 family metallopeptidase [Ferruginibacter sp.]